MATKNVTPADASETTAEPEKRSFNDYFRKISKTAVLIIGIVIFGCIAVLTLLLVLSNSRSIRESVIEYDHLRGLARNIETEYGELGEIEDNTLDVEMREINPDYVCWIRVDGTDIDYPVVRGDDNEKYLNISFSGETNKVGSIFMDYRNTEEHIPHIIIYGHNLQQGGMFTDLRKYLNNQFMEENPIVTLIVNGNEVEFEVFAARLTDISDPAYNLDLNTPRMFSRFANRIKAPIAATQIITLSTCTSGGNDDARVVVQAYRLFK